MHSSELKEQGSLYYWVVRGIEYLDDGEFLEGIMWFQEEATEELKNHTEWPENPQLFEDIHEVKQMIEDEDWPGVLEGMEKLRNHMENMGYM